MCGWRKADKGLNLVAELDFERAAAVGCVTDFRALHPQADLPGDGVNVRAGLDPLGLHVKLQSVSGAIGGRDHPSLQPHGVIQVHAQRFQITNMVQRETLLPAARRRDAGEHHAGQRKPHRRAAPARAQEDESNENAGGRTGQEPMDPDCGAEAMRPHNPQSKARRQRRQGRFESGSRFVGVAEGLATMSFCWEGETSMPYFVPK